MLLAESVPLTLHEARIVSAQVNAPICSTRDKNLLGILGVYPFDFRGDDSSAQFPEKHFHVEPTFPDPYATGFSSDAWNAVLQKIPKSSILVSPFQQLCTFVEAGLNI